MSSGLNVTVLLVADVKGYISSMSAAAKVTTDFGNTVAASAVKHKAAWEQVAKVPMVAGAALLGVGVAAVVAAAEFDKAMSTVKANVDDKSVPSMKRLSDAALQAGRTTMFSANQAAAAENELAKAGLTSAQITGGALTASLTLASAAQLDLGTAAEYTASTMVQFGLKASDAAHIADVLSAAADKSLGNVTDIAEALKYAGVPAAQFGISLNETVGVLAEFAHNGIKGSLSGTGFREMLIKLVAPSKEGTKEIKTLGLSFFDASGNFKGMANMAGELHDKLRGLTQQQREQTLVTLFGQRALAEANILYRDGAAGVRDWTNAVNAQAFATRQARTKLDNLAGDWLKLKNTLSTALIEMGQGGQSPLRSLVQDLTHVTTALANMSPQSQKTALEVATLTGAVLLAGGTFMATVPKIATMKTALAELDAASGMSAGKLTGIAKAAGLVGVAAIAISAAGAGMDSILGTNAAGTNRAAESLLAYSKHGADAAGVTGLMSRGFHNLATTVNDAFNQSLWQKTQNALSWVGTLGILPTSTQEANNFFHELDAGMTNLATSGHAAEAAKAFNQVSDAATKQGYSLAQVKDMLPGYTTAVGSMTAGQMNAATAAGTLTGAAKQNAQALEDQAKAAQAATQANDALITSVENYASPFLGARSSIREFYSAVDAASSALKTNGRTLDITTSKGRANQQTLDNISTATLKMVTHTFKYRDANTALMTAVKGATHQVDQGRAAYVRAATGFGKSRAAAEALATQSGLTADNVATLADTISAVPTLHVTHFKLLGVIAAKAAALDLKNAIDGIHDKTVSIAVQTSAFAVNPNPATPYLVPSPFAPHGSFKAAGGPIHGPGTGTSDSVPLWGSDGEFMMQTSAVNKYGPAFMAQVNAGRFANGGLVGAQRFAGGGFVSADWSGIDAGLGGKPPTQAHLSSLLLRQTRATLALQSAEVSLDTLRRSKHPTAERVALDEERIRVARMGVQAATQAVQAAETSRANASGNLSRRVTAAAGLSNAATARFLHDIATLRAQGFGSLADQLMMQADSQAYTLAHQAVASRSAAHGLQGATMMSASLAARVNAAQQAITDKAQAAALTASIVAHPGAFTFGNAGGVSSASYEASLAAAALLLKRQKGHADGGYISGAGSGTSDSILRRVSNGEYVMRAAVVNRHGRAFFDRLNSGGARAGHGDRSLTVHVGNVIAREDTANGFAKALVTRLQDAQYGLTQ